VTVEQKQHIRRQHQQGVSPAQIANGMRISQSTVSRVLLAPAIDQQADAAMVAPYQPQELQFLSANPAPKRVKR
jgi:IS30 family transposase